MVWVNKAIKYVNIKGKGEKESFILQNYNYNRPFYIKLEALYKLRVSRGIRIKKGLKNGLLKR